MKRIITITVLLVAFATGVGASELLDHGWRFIQGDDPSYASESFDDSSWREVTIPHDWGVEGEFVQSYSGETGKLKWWGTAWYRYHLTLPRVDAHYCLDFSGVMSGASVYVNGQRAGGRPYGYSSWRVEIGHWLHDGDNVIAVRVDNKPASSRWYPGGGIYRNVYLARQAEVDVAYNGVSITTEEAPRGAAKVRVVTTLRNYGDPADLVVTTTVPLPGAPIFGVAAEALEQRKSVAAAGDGATVEHIFTIPAARLWSPENPQLYQLKISILNKATGEKAAYQTWFGIRKAEFTPEGFFLNGERYFIRGVCLHHDAGALGAVWNQQVWQRRLEQLKDMGCNAIRSSHNPPAPELLELCDSMGFLVIDELADAWTIAKTPNDYASLFYEWAERDLVDMIRRDRNHPSVILWSIGNECKEQGHKDKWDIPRRLTEICHREDPSRLTTSGSENQWALEQDYCNSVDVCGLNYKPHFYQDFHKANPQKPYYGSETASCISTRGYYLFPVSDQKGEGWLSQAPCQVSSYDLYAPHWASCPDYEWAFEEENPSFAGEFVWTGFDYLGEPTPYNFNPKVHTKDNAPPSRSSYFGIIDLAGFPKDRYWLYKSHWRPDVPTAHILPHWNWAGREGEVTPVHVYTSGDSGELFVNGISQGIRHLGKGQYRLRWDDVRYAPGEVRVVCWRDGKVWACDTVATAGEPAALKVECERRGQMAFVTVAVVDAAGRVVPTATNEITFELKAPKAAGVRLLATDAGDPTSHVPFYSPTLPAFAGLCSGIIECRVPQGRHHKGAGHIKPVPPAILTVSSPGLESASVTIR